MYSASWRWALAQALLLPNWIAGPAGLIGFGTLFFLRVGREEARMTETFGDEYRRYMAPARILPGIYRDRRRCAAMSAGDRGSTRPGSPPGLHQPAAAETRAMANRSRIFSHGSFCKTAIFACIVKLIQSTACLICNAR